jgi:glycosyltransferase involved in cell wall biosynthesis
MNIVIVTDYGYVNGGAGKIAIGSAKALATAGHNVFLFTAVGPVESDLRELPGLTTICTNQFEILLDPSRMRAAVQGFWNSKASRTMDDLLCRLDASQTVVHVHLWAKALSSSVVRVSATKGLPVVLTLHDFLTRCPNGTLFNHNLQKVCTLNPMSLQCWQTNCDNRKYSHKLWRVARQLVQEYAGLIPTGIRDFISISEFSEDVLRPMLPIGTRVHRIRNFVDAEKKPPIDVRSNSTFVYAGRFAREKGVMLWAECARQLDVPALFIGDGELKNHIQSQYPAAQITGWLSADQARAKLRLARALVFPSLWYETQGLVVAEAAAMGIPSVVSDSCAASDWVVNGETGLWFRTGDPDDLANKISQLRDNPDIAARLGQAAYEHYWRNPPTIESHVTDLESLYISLLPKAAITRPLNTFTLKT